MSISKEERDQWRERLSSPYTCFNAAHADFTLRLLDALEEESCPKMPNIDNIPEILTITLPDAPPCPLCGRHPEQLESEHVVCCKIVVDDIDAWNALPRALTWTDDPPKVPGLYWTRKTQDDRPILFIVYERKTPKLDRIKIEARVFFSSTTSRTYKGETPESLGLEWAGPVPEPREPK